MRAKSIFLLVLALGCGLVASIGITQVMAKRGPAAAPKENTTPIVVALEDIPLGDPVPPQAIKIEDWPKDRIPPGAITKLADLENRRPKTRIFKGSPVLEYQLYGKGADGGGVGPLIPKGYRLVSVKVDDVSGLSSMLRPSDRVDVLVFMNRQAGHDVTRTILQDVKVFAINDVYDLESAGGDSKKNIVARTVSLLVTPTQAQAVTLACELGRIRLVMRSFEDEDQAAPPATDIGQLLGKPETTDRAKESPIVDVAPKTADPVDAFLRSVKPEKVEPPAIAQLKPQETWHMMLLAGPAVNDVVLQREGEASSDEGNRDLQCWRMIGGKKGSPSGSALLPEPAPIPLPVIENPSPASGEKGDIKTKAIDGGEAPVNANDSKREDKPSSSEGNAKT